jgi:hypothetical protein
MIGHGKREAILRANAIRWRDRVRADVAGVAECVGSGEHRLSIEVVHDLIEAIAGCIAAGDDLVIARRNSRRGRAGGTAT